MRVKYVLHLLEYTMVHVAKRITFEPCLKQDNPDSREIVSA